jgi:hypothetical protein
VYTLGSGEGVRMGGGGVQVSDYSVCMPRHWRGGGTALCCRGLGWWLLWWGGEYLLIGLMKQVCRVCWSVVLDFCRSVTDKVTVYSV